MDGLHGDRATRNSPMNGLAVSAAAGAAGLALAAAVATPGRTAVAALPTMSASPTGSPTASASAKGSSAGPAVSVSLGGVRPTASAKATPTPRPHFKTFVVPPCVPGVYYTITYHKPVDMFVPHLEYVDGPGGEMEVWLKRFYLIRFHIGLERETGGEFKIRDFTAKIRKMLSPEIEEEHAIEVGHEYVANIHPHRYGHLRYRVFGVRFGFNVWQVFHNCARLRINGGTATFPTIREGWKYWETKTLRHRTASRKVTKQPDQGSPEP